MLTHLARKDVGHPAAARGAHDLAAQSPPRGGERAERRVPMTRLRARIAERLVQAQATAAMLTTFNEVDLRAVNELRARYKERFEKEHGARLGFMSFFVKACRGAEALPGRQCVGRRQRRRLSRVLRHRRRGLDRPRPDRAGAAQRRHAVVRRNREDRRRLRHPRARRHLTLEELTGGTFTITNGGVFGSLLSTPILNLPQSAILGMHKIQDRPVVVDGQVVVRPMMYLALSYDHRLIDGREAVQFLVAIKESLEDPARLLLQI